MTNNYINSSLAHANNVNYSFQNNHYTIPSSTSTAINQQLQAFDRATGINYYVNQESGKIIESEDYWHKKDFEAQPAFIAGKIMRESIETIGKEIAECVSAFSERSVDLYHSFYEGLKQLPSLFSYHDNDLELDEHVDLKDLGDVNELTRQDFIDLMTREIDEFQSKYLYRETVKLLKEAKKEAEAQGKPLMIMLGESHTSHTSWELENLIIRIAAKKLGIKVILSEPFPGYVVMKEQMDETSYSKLLQIVIEDDEKEGKSPNTLKKERLAIELGLKFIPVDVFRCFNNDKFGARGIETCSEMKKLLSEDEISTYEQRAKQNDFEGDTKSFMPRLEGVNFRNKGMVSQSIQLKNHGDNILVIGEAHAEGMLNDESLQENYYVRHINVMYFREKNNPKYLEYIDHLRSESRELKETPQYWQTSLSRINKWACQYIPHARPCQILSNRTKPL